MSNEVGFILIVFFENSPSAVIMSTSSSVEVLVSPTLKPADFIPIPLWIVFPFTFHMVLAAFKSVA
jgi:hypothetical protein